MKNNSTVIHDIYLINATRKKEQQRRECYNITDILNVVEDHVIKYLLFAHAFTGCDTTSAIHNFGKTSIFKKLKDSIVLRNIADVFYEDLKPPEEIGNACIHFFEKMHSHSDKLPQIRKRKYDEMIRTDRSKIDPSLLPPSPRAAYYHGLRVYHQIKVWKDLSEIDLEPKQWDWKLSNDMFIPIKTDNEPGPSDLLKIVRCTCKEMCDKRCSCKKAGLSCTSSCKECHGLFCNNSEQVGETSNNDCENETDDARHFLDAFL